MNRLEKQEQIDFLKAVFNDTESIVLASVSGINASQIASLRRKLHEGGVSFKVVKNKLARIASQETPVSVLFNDFANSTAVAWSTRDAVAPAKILVKFKEETEQFEVKAGCNSGKRLDFNELKALASLPSLDVLRAQLLAAVQAVSTKLLAQINTPAAHLVGVLSAKVDKEKEAA
jgi:large subunit ribosomal protein L10